jgi:hypothetical protein
MTIRSQPEDSDADVSWVRATLGSANPVNQLTPSEPAPAGWSLATTRSRVPIRRRAAAITAIAVATAAAVIAAVVATSVVGGSGARTTTVAVTSNPHAVLTAYDATVSARSAQGSLIMSVGGTTLVSAKGAADLTSGDADLTVGLPDPIGQVEVRNVGGSSYLQIPPGLSAFAGGKPWVKVDRSTLERLAGGNLSVPALNTGFDFTGVLSWLRGVGQVTPAGSGTSHGDPTAEYHAVIDLSKAAAQAPADEQSRLNDLAHAAGQTVAVDISIDRAGRLRRLQASFDVSKVQLSPRRTLPQAQGVVTATLELWGFGTSVQVVAPSPDQVTDAAPFLSLVPRGAGGLIP